MTSVDTKVYPTTSEDSKVSKTSLELSTASLTSTHPTTLSPISSLKPTVFPTFSEPSTLSSTTLEDLTTYPTTAELFTFYPTADVPSSTAKPLTSSLTTKETSTSFPTATEPSVYRSTTPSPVTDTTINPDSSIITSTTQTCDGTLDCLVSTVASICEEPNGFYPNPSDCRTFYQCIKGTPILSECIEKEHFSPVDRSCQDPCDAECDFNLDCPGKTKTSSQTETPITTTEAIFVRNFTSAITLSTDSSGETTTVPHTQETSVDNTKTSIPSFPEPTGNDQSTYTASTTIATTTNEIISTKSLTSDVEQSTVDWHTTTQKGKISEETEDEDLVQSSTTSTKSTSSPFSLCGDPNGVYPKPSDCRSFYLCVSGVPILLQCNNKLHFSPITRHCELPCYAKCDPTMNCTSDIDDPLPLSLCRQRDILPKQGSCEKYVDCTEGRPNVEKCPNGLHFNPSKRVCDISHNAGCGNPPKPLPSPDRSFTCPKDNCLVPSEQNCIEYHLCRNSTAFHMKCTYGLLFDKDRNTCNLASKTSCDISTTKRPTTAPTTTKETTTVGPTSKPFSCTQPNGIYSNPGSCVSFVHCANWWPYVKQCPSGTHFSAETLRCEFPCEAKCDKSLECVSSTSPPTTPKPSDNICTCTNCRLPNKESCIKYYQCEGGISTKRTCPRGQTFDRKRSTCDWAHRVDCPHSDICSRRNGLFPYKGDCKKFVHCGNGIPYVKECPSGLHFDPEFLRCSWPTGKCEPVLQLSPLQGKTKTEPKWRCPSSFGYFRDEIDCSKFYLCSHGTPAQQECPDGLAFNSKYLTCDWRQNVKCDRDERRQQRRCRRFDRQIQCQQNRSNLAHVHCDMFYDCTTGRACPKRCPDGLYFNSESAMCDLPTNVKCHKRDGDLYNLSIFADKCRQKKKGQMKDPASDSCFYRCQNSRVVRGCCAKNRSFNEAKDKCEWIKG